MKRPTNLQAVAAEGADGAYARLREFLDEFYSDRHDRAAMLADEPPLTGDAVLDAYLAASAAYLARLYDVEAPSWAFLPSRTVLNPWFAPPDGMQAIYLVESPTPFRVRNLFVSHDPLARPGRTLRVERPASWWVSKADGGQIGPSRRLGFLAGQFSVPADFDRMAEAEIVRLFEGD